MTANYQREQELTQRLNNQIKDLNSAIQIKEAEIAKRTEELAIAHKSAEHLQAQLATTSASLASETAARKKFEAELAQTTSKLENELAARSAVEIKVGGGGCQLLQRPSRDTPAIWLG